MNGWSIARVELCVLWSRLELALDSKVFLLFLFFWLLLLPDKATLCQQLIALIAAPLLQAQTLNFLACGVQKEYLGLGSMDHFELRIGILGNVLVDKPFHLRIGIQSSSATALDADMGDHGVRGLFLFIA